MDKNGKRKNRIQKVVMLILVLLVAVSAFFTVRRYLEIKRAGEEYRRLAEEAAQTTEAVETQLPTTEAETEPEPETTQAYESPINFAALAQVNPDTVGWIRIPDTNVDYPIVQAADNDKYLYTGFEGEKSVAGTVYLDFESDSDLQGFNNILYGHNMKNGSMFKDIVKYKDPSYFKDHQFFEIYTPQRTIRLKAIACYYGEADPMVRKTRFKTRQSYDTFLREMSKPCSFREIPDVPVDSLYTLVTCSYEINDARTFLFAVEVDGSGAVVRGTHEFTEIP